MPAPPLPPIRHHAPTQVGEEDVDDEDTSAFLDKVCDARAREVLQAWPLPVLQAMCDIATDLTRRVRDRRSVQSILPELERLLSSFDNQTGTADWRQLVGRELYAERLGETCAFDTDFANVARADAVPGAVQRGSGGGA